MCLSAHVWSNQPFCWSVRFFQKGNTAQCRDVISSCRQLAQESLVKPVQSCTQRCVWAHSSLSHCFWVSSTPMPTKDQQCVFHTTMCWSVCSGMRDISPNSHSVTTTHAHTHPFLLPSGLGPVCSCDCCCCCWLHLITGHRYAAPSHVKTLWVLSPKRSGSN